MKRICILALAVSLCLTALLPCTALAEKAPVSLVPETHSDTPNTFSTWWIQSAEQYSQMAKTGKTLSIRDIVTHDFMFNPKTGWCYTQYPTVKKDMIFVVCDGWELPDSQGDTVSGDPYFGSQIFDAEKFPGYGDTPQERLKTYADNVKAAGWKGAGLWICAQEDAANRPASGYDKDYWIERILWSKYAGITYWEIDWGRLYNNLEWRKFISTTANELYPELVIEHITGIGGLNDEMNSGRVTPAFNKLSAQVASFSDVFRTYDVTTQLTNATTLDRVGELLRDGYVLKGDALGLMCAEDQVYINASLGLTSMVFRHNRAFTNTDEVVRALRWNRIAPAYEISAYETKLSDEYLSDDWDFRNGDTWYSNVNGKTIIQKAPAVIARGIGLATVSTDGADKPFVTAARNPNGAISVATFGRTHRRAHYDTLRADVTLPAGDLTGPVGIFGYYKTLTLSFNQDLTGKRILAQDLLADEAKDITDRVQVSGGNLTLTGELIDELGLSAATMADTSRPGLVLQIGDPADYAAAPQIRERTAGTEENLPVFYNASFEESEIGAVPAAWNFWRGGGTSDDTILTAAGGHTGEKSCRIAAPVAHEGSIGQTFTGIPDGTYTASVWVKGSANTGGINFSAVYGPGDFIATYVTQVLGSEGLTQWTKVTLENINVTNGQIEIQIYYNAAAGEELWLDDFEIRRNTGEHTVTFFDAANGTVIAQSTVSDGQLLLRPADPVKDGVLFDGWTLDGVPYDFSAPVTRDLVLTANWTTHASERWEYDEAGHWHPCKEQDCGERFDEAPHTLEWKIDRAATAEADGVKHQECSICGYRCSENTVIPKTHTHNFHWAHNAEQHWKECVCGETLKAEAHTFVWKVDKEATASAAGVKHEECSICGEKRSEGTVIPKTVVPKTGDSGFAAWLTAAAGSFALALTAVILLKKRSRMN